MGAAQYQRGDEYRQALTTHRVPSVHNAPAQPRRAHVPDEITPHLPPAGGCSGLFGGCSRLRMALAAMRTSHVIELAPPDQNRSSQQRAKKQEDQDDRPRRNPKVACSAKDTYEDPDHCG